MTVIKLLWIARYIISKIKFKLVNILTKQVLTSKGQTHSFTQELRHKGGFPRSTFPLGDSLL